LTDKAHEVVARNPFEVLVRAVDSLNAQEQAAMRDAGIRGLLGRPYDGSSLKQTYEHLNTLVQEHLKSKARR
jgi:hypothetical protein